MDAQRRVIENGAVAITGDHIVDVGPRAQIDKAYDAKQRMDRPNAILTPGLINTHTHAAMSLFRGVADDMNLQDWLNKFIFPAEAKNVTREFVVWGTRLACLEMALSGNNHLHRHVLFRRGSSGNHQGSRPAGHAGRNHHRLSRSRLQNTASRPGGNRNNS